MTTNDLSMARPERRAPSNGIAAGVEGMDAVARERFALDALHPWQREAVELLVEGGQVIVVAPTGGGKSLCYQLPAVFLPGTALVISPLISLMEDQVRALEARGIAATFFASNLTRDESAARLAKLRAGAYDVVYVAPERLGHEGFSSAAAAATLNLVAIDEAHCIVQWGHDFRPEYMRIGDALRRLRPPRVLACTATATPAARREIARQLDMADAPVVLRGFARPNLHLDVEDVRSRAEMCGRVEAALTEARSGDGDGAIVYSATRKGAEHLAEWLTARGLTAEPYHAGMDGAERSRVARAFAERTLDIVVATNAFGMGIDRADVRVVVHAQPPGSLEAYYQEVGRAGRDGEPARGLLLLSPSDVALRRRLCERGADGEPAAPEIAAAAWALFRELLGYFDAATCRHDYILRYFGDEAESLGGCGHCDVCLGADDDPAAVAAGLDVVRRALAGVARAKRRAGLTAVSGMLRGELSARASQLGFDQLSTFGVLREMSHDRVMAVLRVLLAAGWVELTAGEFPVPFVTEIGWKVMKGELEPVVRLPRERPPAPARGRTRTRGAKRKKGAASANDDRSLDDLPLDDAEAALFEALRGCRLELARERGVPPYVVASDRALRALARAKPTNARELEAVPGFGPMRVEAYGAPLLEVIARAGLVG